MKKLGLALAVMATAALLLAGSALAAEEDHSYIDVESVEDGVPESAGDYLKDVDIEDGFDPEEALGNIGEQVLDSLGSVIRQSASGAVIVLAAAVLCSAASSVCPGDGGGVRLAAVAVIAAASAAGVHSLVKTSSGAVEELVDFSKLLLPVLASASAVTGTAASAAAKYAASALFLDVLMTIGQKVVLPLIYMYLAVSVGEAAFGGGLGGVKKLISRAVKLMLTGVAVTFTLYLTITGLVASSADAATVKVTKTLISTVLPVVGGMISDAADAVASGVGLLKSAVGVFGMLVVVSVCAMPFLRLAASCVLFRISAALSETVADSRISGLIEAVSSSYGMALGLVGTTAIMLLISLISVLRVVTGT